MYLYHLRQTLSLIILYIINFIQFIFCLGAVITGKHFLHPVSLAKKIMTESPHCALSGDGAFNFAEKQNIPRCAPKELVSRQRTLVSQKDHPDWVNFNYQNRPREQIGDGPLVSALDKNSVTPNAIGSSVVFFNH